MAGALNTLRNGPPQAGHSASGASVNDCTTSRCSPQDLQAYSYFGIRAPGGPGRAGVAHERVDSQRISGRTIVRVDDPRARLREFRHALARLGGVLASTRDRQVMVSALLETTTTYLGAPAGVFYIVVAGSERLRPVEKIGTAAEGPLGELTGGRGLAGAASS